jgi:Zn-dependent M28 family amino/carboxypeptidase
VPIGQLNLDLNFEKILPFGQGDQFHPYGAQRTTFFPTVEAVAKQFGYSIPRQPPDTAGGSYRSDHFSFAHAGVPAFSLGQGGTYKGHDEAWSRAQSGSYGKNDYHNVSDNFHEDWDFTGNATLCRLGIELGWLSVTQPPIEWKPGDEFEAARKAAH